MRMSRAYPEPECHRFLTLRVQLICQLLLVVVVVLSGVAAASRSSLNSAEIDADGTHLLQQLELLQDDDNNDSVTSEAESWRNRSRLGTSMKSDASVQIFMDDGDDDDGDDGDDDDGDDGDDDDGIRGWLGIWNLATSSRVRHRLSSSSGASRRRSHRPRPRRLAVQEEWCVAKANQASGTLQGALDWACGTLQNEGQVDCSPIQSTGACYNPNTLQAHCNWAFNAYYVEHSSAADPCDFAGSAVLTTVDPSTTGCTYTGVTSSGNSSSTGSGNFNSSTGNSSSSTGNGTGNGTGSGTGSGSGSSNITTNSGHEMEQQSSFQISVVVAIMYFLFGQAL